MFKSGQEFILWNSNVTKTKTSISDHAPDGINSVQSQRVPDQENCRKMDKKYIILAREVNARVNPPYRAFP